ncbi:MAG: NAD(P)-dependent oxidoreductase [Thaumarchaeota archaeon]|nr:NAD(P)-dependent oxidoreductase [Nitrososphaerota archaeon]
MTDIGIIGTGMLGCAICKRLLKLGFKLTVYNRTKSKADNLVKLGATIANTPKDIALNSNVILTVVTDSHSVNSISFGKNGIVFGKHKGLVVFDISTINPIHSIKIAQKFSKYNIEMLDAPVMGGPNVAVNGKLIMMISGKKKIYEKYKQILNCIANKTFYLGKYGTSHLIKLALNIQIAFLAVSISEGILLTKKSSIDPKLFLHILNSTYFKTGISENKAYKMIDNSFQPTFTLKNLKKDLDTVISTAHSLNLKLPITKNINNLYKNAFNSGFGELDYTGIFKYLTK